MERDQASGGRPDHPSEGEGTGKGPRRRGTVLVTGSSSGIGADLARAFARRGRDLVLVARSRERLDELARELIAAHGVRVRVLVSDLAAPGAAVAIQAALRTEDVEVETLVNNAGFGQRGAFVDLGPDRQSEMIQVNVTALTELCRVFAPDMVRRGRGGILNVAGLAGVMPGPSMAVYCATKAYVLSFTEALANELRGTGVTVTCLSPGPTETRFGDAAGFSALRFFRVSAPRSPMTVAEAGVAALERGAGLEVPGWRNKLLAASVRLVPTRTAAAMARYMLESPPSEAKTLRPRNVDPGTRQLDQTEIRTQQALGPLLVLAAYILDDWRLVAAQGGFLLLTALHYEWGPYVLLYRWALRPLRILDPDLRVDNPEPHRFAAIFGFSVLSLAVLLLETGHTTAGWMLAGAVAVLGGVAFFGWCAGCFMYYVINRAGAGGFFGRAPVRGSVFPGARPPRG